MNHLTPLLDKLKQDGIQDTGDSWWYGDEVGLTLASSNDESSPELVELHDLSDKWR